MEKHLLSNGATLLFQKTTSPSVAIEVMIKVGSNDESDKNRGISHFLEHMLFEGTKRRPNSNIIASEIEQYGAEFNAYTSADKTAFFIKIIKKNFDKAMDILSDMLSNSLFDEKKIEKERQVILREIDMVTDDPRQHQWVLFQKNIFRGHPTGYPTYGSPKSVKAISRKDILHYYRENYFGNNMIISVVGNVSGVKKTAEKYFTDVPKKEKKKIALAEAIRISAPQVIREKRDIQNSYMVLGFRTVSRDHSDSYVFDVIYGVLGRPQSGWIFEEIRNKKGLSYQAGVQNDIEQSYGTIAAFAGLDKKNIKQAKEIILRQFDKLKRLSIGELNISKTFLEGHKALELEDTFRRADELAGWEFVRDAKIFDDYIRNIQEVTVQDVRRVAKKFFNDNYTLVAIEQK